MPFSASVIRKYLFNSWCLCAVWVALWNRCAFFPSFYQIYYSFIDLKHFFLALSWCILLLKLSSNLTLKIFFLFFYAISLSEFFFYFRREFQAAPQPHHTFIFLENFRDCFDGNKKKKKQKENKRNFDRVLFSVFSCRFC